MNPLRHYLNPNETIKVYQRIHQKLGIDGVIFSSMEQISQRRSIRFNTPISSTDHPRKHKEIESYLGRFCNMPGREALFFELIEEIYLQLQTIGNMQSIAEQLLDTVNLPMGQNCRCRLTDKSVWVIEWDLPYDNVNGFISYQQSVITHVFGTSWGEIIPWDIIQYIRSGILLYQQNSYATALALMSIAVEATLRDVLSTRGYTHTHGANRDNIYQSTSAEIDVSNGSYLLTFADSTLQSAASLTNSAGRPLPVSVEIKRKERASAGRVELVVKCPQYLLDHWSSNKISQPANNRNIGGLGEALRIARDDEKIIDAVDLPPDIDQVLKLMRNNLIHFSSDSLETDLTQYASYSNTGRFTLRDFISNKQMVFDFISAIPRFVNDQYEKLWGAGIRIP